MPIRSPEEYSKAKENAKAALREMMSDEKGLVFSQEAADYIVNTIVDAQYARPGKSGPQKEVIQEKLKDVLSEVSSDIVARFTAHNLRALIAAGEGGEYRHDKKLGPLHNLLEEIHQYESRHHGGRDDKPSQMQIVSSLAGMLDNVKRANAENERSFAERERLAKEKVISREKEAVETLKSMLVEIETIKDSKLKFNESADNKIKEDAKQRFIKVFTQVKSNPTVANFKILTNALREFATVSQQQQTGLLDSSTATAINKILKTHGLETLDLKAIKKSGSEQRKQEAIKKSAKQAERASSPSPPPAQPTVTKPSQESEMEMKLKADIANLRLQYDILKNAQNIILYTEVNGWAPGFETSDNHYANIMNRMKDLLDELEKGIQFQGKGKESKLKQLENLFLFGESSERITNFREAYTEILRDEKMTPIRSEVSQQDIAMKNESELRDEIGKLRAQYAQLKKCTDVVYYELGRWANIVNIADTKQLNNMEKLLSELESAIQKLPEKGKDSKSSEAYVKALREIQNKFLFGETAATLNAFREMQPKIVQEQKEIQEQKAIVEARKQARAEAPPQKVGKSNSSARHVHSLFNEFPQTPSGELTESPKPVPPRGRTPMKG